MHINKNKQAQPDHVYKVPVPGNCFKAKMLIRFEMAFRATKHDHRQHNGAKRHMQAVKAGQHEKMSIRIFLNQASIPVLYKLRGIRRSETT